jgi:hypothetical protein
MPTVNQGNRTSFWDTVGLVQDISAAITMLSPYDTPLLHAIGPCRDKVIATKHEWLEDELVPAVDKLDAAIEDTTGTSVTVENGKYFLPDDVIKVDSEVMLVTAVNTSTNVLTVTRGFGGTTKATHADAATVDRIGNAKAEGADAGASRTTEKTSDYNYTQIFDATIEVTGTREAVAQHGIASEYAYQLAKKIKERAIDVEKALVHGVRYSDTTNERRTMGGLLQFLDQNVVDAAGAAVTRDTLDDIIADIWRAGGEPRTMVMNIDQKYQLDRLYEDAIRVDRTDHGLGGFISYFENSLGRFDIIVDRWVPRNSIMLLDRSRVGISPLNGRDWQHTLMGKVGDKTKGQMLTELTVEVRGRKAHGLIKNLSL